MGNENDIEMNIQVDSQVNNKGVDEAAKGMADIATKAGEAEKKIKDVNKQIAELVANAKATNEELAKLRSQKWTAIGQLVEARNKRESSEEARRGIQYTSEVSGARAIEHRGYAEKLMSVNTDTDASHLSLKEIKNLVPTLEYTTREMEKFGQSLRDKIKAERDQIKNNYYSKASQTRARENYEKGESLYRKNEWLKKQGQPVITEVENKDGTIQSAEDVMKYYLMVQEELKERADLEKQIKDIETKELLARLEARNKNSEQKITEAEEQEAQAAQESADKKKKMTEFQEEKIKIAKEQLELEKKDQDLAEKRIVQKQKELELKEQKQNSPEQQFRNAHPELYALRGGQYFSKKYQAAGALSTIGGKLSSLGTGGKMVGDILDTVGAFLRSPIAGAATALTKLTTGIIDLTAASMKAYAEIESIKTQLGVVFSNQTQADAMFGQISQYAVHSPFGVQQTSELAVLLKQSGVYASDLMNTLKMLGDTAGGNMEKMKRIANNYAQIVSIGKASMLDMRQFAYAGIPIFEAVSKELGVSQKELRKMISDGKVTSDIIAKVFKDLTGINGIFEKATEKGAKTLKARMQNLQDAKQLALSTFGERLVMNGSTYGNDSPVLTLITDIENMFQWWKEHNDTKNIERDVNLIANNKDRIKELEEVLKMAESTGDKELIKLVKQELEFQKNNWGYDKQRLVYSTSYDIKNAEADRYREKYGEYDEEYHKEIAAKLVEAQTKLFYSDPRAKSQLGVQYTYRSEEERAELQKQVEMYNLLNNELAKFAQALRTVNKTTEEEIKAKRERDLINDQQAAFDKVNTMADSSTSLLSQFQELNEIYTASDEYKKKKEEENQKALKEALGYLKEIAKHTDEQGNVDITGWSAKEFNKWSGSKDGKAAMEAAKKLQVVNSDRRYSQEERSLLVSQYGHFQTELENYLTKTMGSSFDKFIYDNFKLNNLGTKSRYSDEEFYDLFSELYYNNEDQIKNAKDLYAEQQRASANRIQNQTARQSALAQAEKRIEAFNAQMDEFSEALRNSTIQYQTQNGAAEMSESELGKDKSQFIALWKRIFASNTGLSTQGMINPRQTLDLYLTDVSQRKIVSNVMKATLDTMGVDAATNLLRSSGKQSALPDAKERYVNQIDWKKSAEGLREFATRLSASTDVVTAYTQGLEEEYEALSNLIVQGATELESQDLKDQKMVTLKQLNKLSEAGQSEAASQLVNALGDKIEKLGGGSVTYKDGKFYDEKGLEISEDQLKVSDDIFDYLKQLLPDIKRQIAEGRMSGENSRLLSEQLQKILPSTLSRMMMGGNPEERNIDRLLLDNPDYAVTQARNAFDIVTANHKDENGSYKEGYEWLSNTSLDDIFRYGLDSSSSNYEESLKLIEEIITIVRTVAAELTDPGSGYNNLKEIENYQDITDAATAMYRRAYDIETDQKYSTTAWADKGGVSLGNKVVNDLFGVNVGYTRESLYDAYKEDHGLGVSDELDETIKKQILFKTALEETRDVMQKLGDETANLVGTLGKKAFTIPFEKLGESAMNYWSQALSYEEASEKCAEDQKQAYRELGTEALQALGPIMQKAGFEMVARGAIDDSWGMILGGLGLAAAGGFASGLGNALSANNDKDKDEAAKIQDLKDQLADLLEQARKDALYYENNLRHKTALGINKEFSYQSVNDAVITPDGDVITTDPKDYLIATKTPGQFAGGGTVTPIINCYAINNSSSRVRQEQQQNPDGSIDIITIIEDTVGNYIASSKSDDAFSARNSRIRGRQAIMS